MIAHASCRFLKGDRRQARMVGCLFVLCVVAVVGCGSDYATAPVSGRVTCNDVPVSNATVFFAPQAGQKRAADFPGKAAYGSTDAEGNFTLTTYEDGDGAIIGKHIVSVRLNLDPETGNDRNATFAGRDKTVEVTVIKGRNEIDIDL